MIYYVFLKENRGFAVSHSRYRNVDRIEQLRQLVAIAERFVEKPATAHLHADGVRARAARPLLALQLSLAAESRCASKLPARLLSMSAAREGLR